MAGKSPYTLRDQLVALLQTYTQKEVGRMLGRSERTVRRWINNEKWAAGAAAPIQPTEEAGKAIAKAANKERRRIKESYRRQGVTPDRQPGIEEFPVPPVGTRRKLRVYKDGEATGDTKDSAWVNYDMRRWPLDQVRALLVALAARESIVQFVTEMVVPTEKLSSSVRVLREVGKFTYFRGGSGPIELAGKFATAGFIEELLKKYVVGGKPSLADSYPKPYRCLYIAVHDAGMKKRPRRAARKRGGEQGRATKSKRGGKR